MSDTSDPTANHSGMLSGTVTAWNHFGGWGFIAPDDPSQAEVHVHYSKLEGFPEAYQYLGVDERVHFLAEPGQPDTDGRPRQSAIKVRPMAGRQVGVVVEYDFQRGYGSLEDLNDGQRFFLHQSNMLGQGMKDADAGDRMTFVPGLGPRGTDGGPVALEVKAGDPRLLLYRFAQFPARPADWLDPLSEKASEEVWDYQYERSGEGGHVPILRYYIEQTFVRLREEADEGRGTIVESERADGTRIAVFNTGLVTNEEEAIFALFVENQNPDRFPWFLRGFYSVSDRELSEIETELPPPADYLGDAERLVIRPEEIRNMRVDFHHIVVEHLDRFPQVLIADPNLAGAALRGDIARLPDRIRRNYKAAVPQRYRGEIQMFLPLDLVAPRGNPDLVLVVERREGICRANTVLGVDAAYRQARLIARPDPEWLGQAWRSVR